MATAARAPMLFFSPAKFFNVTDKSCVLTMSIFNLLRSSLLSPLRPNPTFWILELLNICETAATAAGNRVGNKNAFDSVASWINAGPGLTSPLRKIGLLSVSNPKHVSFSSSFSASVASCSFSMILISERSRPTYKGNSRICSLVGRSISYLFNC